MDGLEEYLKIVEDPLLFLFRGVPCVQYDLVPSVAKYWKEGTFPLLDLERKLLIEFKRRALLWLSHFRPVNDWDWVMLAQHHGVPLACWIGRPTLWLRFFSHVVVEIALRMGVVYVAIGFPCWKHISASRMCQKWRRTTTLRHPISPSRIPAQAAYFTVSKNPAQPFVQHVERSIIVRAGLKQDLLDKNRSYG